MAVTAFLVNLLCSVVSCDVPLPTPEILDLHTSQSTVFTEVLTLEPFVDTKYGSLQGYAMRTSGNRRIYAFEGIPYAEPPAGFFRFKTAQPKEPWNGLREAKAPGPECLQLSLPKTIRVVGSEDCLYLNVYTPQVPFIDGEGHQVYFEPFPVVVVIHGGSYYFGSGKELGPSYLLNKDVILVTFNYRLGILGFLSTGDHNSPGNYGLKDQSMAIQWVYENIASFGGDPNRITILGQSSGAACTHLHLIANKTTQYFQSGVSLSGSAFTHWAIKSPSESRRLTTTIANILNCPTRDNGEMVNCLKQRNPVELVSAQYRLLEFSPFPVTLFSPVVEPPGPDSFLTQKPEELYLKNQVARKPWIFGMTSQEGYLGLLFLQSFITEGILRRRWNELAPIFFDYKYIARNVTQITNRITRFYFGYQSPVAVPESKIAAAFGDRLMLAGIYRAIELHSAIAPTYASVFGFKGKYTLGEKVGRSSHDWGVGHAEDLYYYFNSSMYYPGFRGDDVQEHAMSKLMNGILANFAARGEPLLAQPNSVNARLWDPVQPQNVRFLQLNREVKMIPQPYKKRYRFWQKLGQIDPLLLDPSAIFPVIPVPSQG